MAAGKKTGGRTKGVPNAATLSVKNRLAELGCDYVGYLSRIVMNNLPCRVCRGTGKTKFQPAGSERFQGTRTCQSCWGSKLEKISPELGFQAAARLMDKCEPQLKALEVSNPDGTMRPTWMVIEPKPHKPGEMEQQ